VKATSSERGLPTVKGKVGVELKALYAEHGLLEINAISDAGLKFGQRIELSVHYADGTINLHSVLWGVRGSQVEETFGIEH
jgi:D-serine deaminase-like pyridoxal phosphate-dependent protein